MHKLVRRGLARTARVFARSATVRQLLLCGALALAGLGAVAQPQSVEVPAATASAAPLNRPLRNEEEYTAQLNAELQAAHEDRERRRIRAQWISAATLSGLLIAFAALVGWALRSRQPLVVRLSRLALWTPCLLLASAWFFPWSLYGAIALAPVFAAVWWKRALSWWELGVATVLYMPALVFTWFVFSTLAAMGRG